MVEPCASTAHGWGRHCDECGRVEPLREPDDAELCGCGSAGIGLFDIGTDIGVVQRCDDCNLYETDDDAADVVSRLLKALHAEWDARGGTVTAALERLEKAARARR